ncbi:MAG TPA: hypothetical protein VFL95_07140, partial [Gemmatimonadales bacterium]|nr:hypothetical protein [Gemmatimonadales bacterium]
MPSSPLLFLLLALSLAACRDRHPPVRDFDGAAAFRYVQQQVAFGPRVPGTEAHRQMAHWLDSMLQSRADTVIVQRWDHVTTAGDTLHLSNFIARFRPAATRRVLFMAHWDSRPTADSPTSPDSTKPVPGANDG